MNFKTVIFAGLSLPLLTPGLAFAQGAAAQPAAGTAPACVAGKTAEWLGGSAEAGVLSGSAVQSSVTLGSGMSNVYAFRVEGESRQVRVELGSHSNGDPHLTILSATGQPLGEQDDFEGSLASRLEPTLAPGDYCAVARDVSNGPLTAVMRVSEISDTPIVTSEGGGSSSMAACTAATEAVTLDPAALATALTEFTMVSETFSGMETAKYYRFDLPAGANLRLTATSAQLDPKITLYDADGAQVAENDDTDGTNARLDMLGSLPAGTYCLGAMPLSTGSGDIRVSVGGVDPAEVLRDAYRNGQIPPSADSGYTVDALDITSVEPQVKLLGNSALWFRFDTTERQVLVINAYGAATGVDSRLALFDSFGRSIAENDDSNNGTDPQIGPVILDPGSYRLALTVVGSDGSNGQMRAVSLGVQRFIAAK